MHSYTVYPLLSIIFFKRIYLDTFNKSLVVSLILEFSGCLLINNSFLLAQLFIILLEK